MAKDKKYFWLKLKQDFFDNLRMKKLRSIAGGDTYTIIYLKMQLLSLQDEGTLFYEQVEDSFEKEIALIINENVEDVRLTISFLLANGLLEQTDDYTYELPETKMCIGTESESKERVRKHRERKLLRQNIELQMVKKLSNEQLALPDGSFKFIDNKRYGGNAEYVYDLANCRCEYCGESDGNKLLIHHNNGYSNDLEDLYLLCYTCHANVENGNIVLTKHNRRSVTCNTFVTPR